MTATAAVSVDMPSSNVPKDKLNSINIDTLFYLAEPMIIGIISDIAMSHPVDPELVYVRHKLYRDFKQITGRTHIFYDTDIDKTVRWIFSDDEIFANHGYILLDALEPWTMSDSTHWDGARFSPVLHVLRQLDKSKSINCEQEREAELVN